MAIAVLILVFAILLAGRIPIAFALGLSSLAYLLLFLPQVSLTAIPHQMFAGADMFALTAIPFFVLMGELMNAGGISARLVGFTRKLVGHFTGGMGFVSLISSMIFASFSGSAIANAAGTGAVTIPAMIRSGYARGLAAAIESASSSLGAIVPPSIPMIVYGSIAGVSIGGLFVAGYVPGILFATGLTLVIRASARRSGVPLDARASLREVLWSGWVALPALLTPVLIMGSILGGVMSPTEAGAVGAVYAFVVATVVYRELRWRDLPRVLANTAVTTGMVMLVMTAAASFSWILAFERIPSQLAAGLVATVHEPWILMVALVALMLVLGMFIDTISALIILTPVVVPVAVQMGIDPLFLGVIMTLTLTFGVLTPPVGTVLFVTAGIASTSIERVSQAIIPFLLVLLPITFLLAVLPDVVLWVPRMLGFR